MTGLIVDTIVSPPLETNCYLLADAATAQAWIIDPSLAGDTALARCRARGWTPVGIFLTHGHIDHTHDTARLARLTGAPVMAHAETAALLADPVQSGAAWLGMQLEPCAADRILADGDRLALGESALLVLHTPGHSRGCVCLLGEGVCFTGDVLFRDGVGRWDLPGGDLDTLQASLGRLAGACPDAAQVYPGHGPATTFGRERRENPYLCDWLGK